MGFNHRILAHKYKDQIYFQVHEVLHDEKGKPDGYTDEAVKVVSDSLEGIKWTLEKMTKCIDKPILSAENFPEEYKH